MFFMRQKRFFCVLLTAALAWSSAGGFPVASASSELEWRPLIKRPEQYMGADQADLPYYYAKGKYGGEGMQFIQGAAVHADGTVLMGQDMGSARVSDDFGRTWYTPPNAGNPLISGNSCAIDPADSDIMFIEMSANTMGTTHARLRSLEGVYRSTNRGQSWTLVCPFRNVGYTGNFRYYKDNFACYPVSGGTPEERIWRFAVCDQDGRDGAVFASTGGVNWTKVADMPAATYGTMFDLVQHPTQPDTLYLCTATGLWESTDGGATWARAFPDSLSGSGRGLWIDPEQPGHMIASIASSDAAKRGVYETRDGAAWTRILSDINPGQLSVGAKNANGKRMLYVHNAQSGGAPRVRNFDDMWITPQMEASDPAAWAQSGLSGMGMCAFLAHPTAPDRCLNHGLAFWWRSEGTEGQVWTDSSTNYFGPGWNQVVFDQQDWQKFWAVFPDTGTAATTTGGDWFTESSITGLESGGQWSRMQAVAGANAVSFREGHGMAVLPDPWPADAPPPASPQVPGRRVLSLGGNTTHFLFTQDVGQTDWTDWIEQPVEVGGGGTRRNRVFASYQNPNIVYAGPNVSTDGATTWGITSEGLEVCAMSYLNGDLVYSVRQDKELLRSFDRGQTWEPIYKANGSITNTRGAGYVYADPFSDSRLYVKSETGDILLLQEKDGAWTGTDLNLRGMYSPVPPSWGISQVCPDPNVPGLLYALLNLSGQPMVWRGRMNADFTACSWEDITQNAPRIAQSAHLSISPVTGDVVLGSGNGNFVYPAPDDWEHREEAKRPFKRALWNNLPLPIPNGWVNIPENPDGSDRVMVNGALLTDLEVPPRRENDRLFLPMRAVLEALGADLLWEEATGTVTAHKDGITVVLTVGSTTATVNGEEMTLDAAPFLEEGRTMVPVRFVAQGLGGYVEWNEPLKTALILA